MSNNIEGKSRGEYGASSGLGEAAACGGISNRCFRPGWIASLIALDGICSTQVFCADLNPANMPIISTVNTRFQSFNTEMLEVTGGRFWKPYKDVKPEMTVGTPGTDLYQYRPPIDLTQARLRKLAAAPGPMFLRANETCANSTCFHDADGAAPARPPKGFNGVERKRRSRLSR